MTRKVGFASLIMMGSVFASRLIGMLREMAIAYAGGAGGGVDAYQVAFILPEILNHCVASGFLSITFIPIFTRTLSSDRETEGWKIFSIIYNTFGLLLVGLIIVSWTYAGDLVRFLAPGIHDPEVTALAVKMTRIILPAQFFFFSGGLYMAVQFARESFFIPALAPLLYNLGIILGGILLAPYLGMEGFAWGVLAGAFLGNFAVQFMGARRIGMKHRFIISLSHPDFRTYVFLTIPLMIGLTMTFSTELLLKFFGSFLTEGSIAALNYALRIMFILVGLFGQAVGTASYPFMAGLAARGDMQGLNNLLNATLKVLLLVIPVSVLFMSISHELVRILFQHGAFDASDTALTAGILPYILAGTCAYAAQTVVVRGYYAIQNTWFPAVIGTVCVVASLPVFFLFKFFWEARGIALALSVSAFLQTSLLYVLWNRRSSNANGNGVYLFFCKMVGIALGLGLILLKTREVVCLVLDPMTLSGAMVISVFQGIIFIILFLLSAHLFSIKEASDLIARIRVRLFRKPG